MALPAFLGPLSTALGGLFSAGLQERGQRDANATNLQIARETNRQETMLSNTAYQRAVRDMRRAGLNPAVMFNVGGGSAAQVPSLSSAVVESTTKDSGKTRAESALAASAVAEAASRISLNRSSAKLADVQAGKALQDTASSAASTRLLENQASWSDSERKFLDKAVKGGPGSGFLDPGMIPAIIKFLGLRNPTVPTK